LPSILATIKGLDLKACPVTVNNSTSLKALRLFEEKSVHDFVYNFIGIHPQYAAENISKFEEIVTDNVNNIMVLEKLDWTPRTTIKKEILKRYNTRSSTRC
jgi:Tat protein secretion system quality control protein TatD with DNase activity